MRSDAIGTKDATASSSDARTLLRLLAKSRRAELRYRALIDHAQEAMCIVTPEGVILDANRQAEVMHRLTRQQLIGRNIRELVAPDYADQAEANYASLVSAGGGRSPAIPFIGPDGARRYHQFSTSRITLDGEVVMFAISHDVTETLEARERLEASERKYRTLIEHIPDVVWTATKGGKVTYISPRVEAVCGFTPEEVVTAPDSFWLDRIHVEDLDAVRKAYELVSTDHPCEAEYRWLRKDGEWIWIRSQAILAEGDGALVAEGTFEDVTQRHFLEDQVRQSQKMEAIGRLTGGVAHDFNNILAIILGNGRFLLDDLPEGDPRRADALAMVEAGERAAALTRQLLMFSRRQVVKHERLDVNGIVIGLEKMLRRIIGEDIDLTLALTDTPGAGAVVADAGELEQVIMNLVVNARDAMPGGGSLTIETARVELDSNYAELHPDVAAGRYVVLSVTDSGCGMDAKTQRHAFEPFFTTKGQGQGTGLGLATCYGIVRGCQGQISLDSEVGHGTVFKVYLPEAIEASVADIVPAAHNAELTGHETILLIEDDDALRKTVHRILVARGYSVLDSTGSGDALLIGERHRGPIDLVLSDMVMPGLSGPDTVARLLASRPSVKVLYMSGYSDHALLRRGSTEVTVNFIQKPFAPQTLSAKIRAVLDDP